MRLPLKALQQTMKERLFQNVEALERIPLVKRSNNELDDLIQALQTLRAAKERMFFEREIK
jgi:hypothetical protein